MMLEDQIAELEAGFQDLVAGLRAILQGQQAKIAELEARLEERREMVSPVVSAPVVGAVPMIERRKRKYQGVEKRCVLCPTVMQNVSRNRKYCDDCFARLARERMAVTRANARRALQFSHPVTRPR